MTAQASLFSSSFTYQSFSYESSQGGAVAKTSGDEESSNTTDQTTESGSLSDRLKAFEKNLIESLTSFFEKVSSDMQQELLNIGDGTKLSELSNNANTQDTQSLMDYLFGDWTRSGNSSNISANSVEIQAQTINLEIMVSAEDGISAKQVDITLQQSFMQQSSLTLSKEMSPKLKMLDPIVIDFNGKGAELSDEKFSFDLDSDGTEDQISMLKKGSGYLALDKNNNGKIDDGSELFGTKSGDGFADLKQYDENDDGKIDSEDSIYDKLRIWRKNDEGDDELVGLGEAGVGVVHLNAQELKNNIYDSSGNLSGIAQKSAAVDFLNGTSSKAYHLDLVAV